MDEKVLMRYLLELKGIVTDLHNQINFKDGVERHGQERREEIDDMNEKLDYLLSLL